MANNDRLFSTVRKKRKLKDKKVSFLSRETKTDDYGTPLPGEYEYVTRHSDLWAYVRQTSAKEIADFRAGALVEDYKVELLITINYREGITHDLLVKFRDNLYEIVRIDYFEFYKEDIVISVKRYEDD